MKCILLESSKVLEEGVFLDAATAFKLDLFRTIAAGDGGEPFFDMMFTRSRRRGLGCLGLLPALAGRFIATSAHEITVHVSRALGRGRGFFLGFRLLPLADGGVKAGVEKSVAAHVVVCLIACLVVVVLLDLLSFGFVS